MKFYMRSLLFLLLFSPLSAFAQFTTVTATITDQVGNPYANCSYNIDFINNTGIPQLPLLGGTPFQTSYGGSCSSTATMTARIPDTAVVTPAGTQWRFSICDTTGKTCFLYTAPACPTAGCITGTTIDISAVLKAASAPLGTPLLPGVVGGSLIPTVDNAYNLGAISLAWANIFAVNVNAKRISGVRNVDNFSNNIAAAIADLPSCGLANDLNSYTNPPNTYNSYTFNHCGTVYMPQNSYTVASSISITSPYVTLIGSSSGGTLINWTGTTGCAIDWTTSPFVDDWVGTGGLYNVRIDGFNGSAGTCGVKSWDNTGWHAANVAIVNFNKAGSIGLWEYDSAEWNEKWYVQIVFKNNTTDWLAQRSATSGGTTLGYGQFDMTMDVFSGQTGLVVDGGSQNSVELSHSFLHITANLVSNPANATAIQCINGGQIINNLYDVHIEAPFGMGTGHEFNLATGTNFTGVGNIQQDFPGSNISTSTTLGILLNGIAGATIDNNLTIYWKDAAGVARPWAIKDSANNTYFYGDTNQQTIIFQPVPGTTLLTMGAAGITLPPAKSIAFGVNAGNQPLLLGDTASPSHLQIRGGSGGGQFWNNAFGATIGTWDDAGNWALPTLAIGGGSRINAVYNGTATLTYTAIAAQTSQEQTMAITGASTTNFGAFCSPRATLGNANISWSSWVSATNTVSVRVTNQTAGSITPSAVAWGCTVNQ